MFIMENSSQSDVTAVTYDTTRLENNTDVGTAIIDYISLKNDQNAILLLPAICMVAVLMLIGFVGNSLVLYVYTRPRPRSRHNTKRIFILTLAIFDIINCGLVMPFEIYDMRNQYDFPDKYTCKAFRFFEATLVLSGGFTLLAVSIDRYVNLVKSSKIIITPRRAKALCVFCVVVSLFFAWPALLFAGTENITFEHKGHNYTGTECTGVRTKAYEKMSAKLYYYILMLTFVIALIILIVIYAMIGVKIYTRRRGSTKHGLTYISNSSSSSDSQSLKDGKTNKNQKARKNLGLKARTSSVGYAIGNDKAKVRGSTLVFYSVTVVFILGFLPHLIVRTLKFTNTAFHDDELDDVEKVVYNILVRSYMLNATANPFIYSILNLRFRKELATAIRRCFGFGCASSKAARRR